MKKLTSMRMQMTRKITRMKKMKMKKPGGRRDKMMRRRQVPWHQEKTVMKTMKRWEEGK